MCKWGCFWPSVKTSRTTEALWWGEPASCATQTSHLIIKTSLILARPGPTGFSSAFSSPPTTVFNPLILPNGQKCCKASRQPHAAPDVPYIWAIVHTAGGTSSIFKKWSLTHMAPCFWLCFQNLADLTTSIFAMFPGEQISVCSQVVTPCASLAQGGRWVHSRWKEGARALPQPFVSRERGTWGRTQKGKQWIGLSSLNSELWTLTHYKPSSFMGRCFPIPFLVKTPSCDFRVEKKLSVFGKCPVFLLSEKLLIN